MDVVHDIVKVECDFNPMLACAYPDLAKNLVFVQEGGFLGRQNFDAKFLNHCEMKPIDKQHRNDNMNREKQRFTLPIEKTEKKLQVAGCDLCYISKLVQQEILTVNWKK